MRSKAIFNIAVAFICCFTLTAESQRTGNGDKGKGPRGGDKGKGGKGKGNGGAICHDTIKDILMQLVRETPQTESFQMDNRYSLVPLYMMIANGHIRGTEEPTADLFKLSGMTEDDGTKKFILTYNSIVCEDKSIDIKARLKSYIENFAQSVSYGQQQPPQK